MMPDRWESTFLCVSVLGTIWIIFATKLWIYLFVCGLIFCLYKWFDQRNSDWINTQGKAVLITGCDTGFGHDLALRLDNLGCVVFAGCLHSGGSGARALRRAGTKKLHVVPMDVGSDESVAKALHYVKEHCPRAGLWGIVNNAGFNVMGDVELLGVTFYHKAMNVNFYGAARVIRSFMYLVRKHKGRIVVISSGRGCWSWPRDSAYHVTKHCLETFSHSLRLEMRKFGVQVSVVRPGHFGMATACQDSAQFERYTQELTQMWDTATEEQRQAYGTRWMSSLLEVQKASMETSATDPKPVIDVMVHALFWDRPRTHYNVDGSNGWIDKSPWRTRLFPFLPTWLTDYLVTRDTGCDKFPE